MKKSSFYSQKNKDKFLWIPVILFFSLIYACGPSRAELEEQAKNQSGMRHVTIHLDDCFCQEYQATYYDVNGCEYVGRLTNSSHDVLSHSGQCKRCEKQQIHLMDSIVKTNLKQFFSIKP